MSCRCRTKFRFLYRTGGWYHWESVLPVRGSLHEHVTCPVAWFWSWPNWKDETLLHDHPADLPRGRLMEKHVTRGPVYVLYTYPEKEFKEKLGISDPEPVLTVERHARTGEFIVRLRRED